MTAIEIILIIIGFLCLCVSCFVAKKNSGFAEGEKESLSSELWTEKEEEKIKEEQEKENRIKSLCKKSGC